MRIAITHPNIMGAGGAEVTFAMLVEELQTFNNLTVITDNKIDFNTLNGKFDTKMTGERIRIIRPLPCRLLGKIEPRIHKFAKVQTALINRYAKKHRDEFDLLISTKQEADFGKAGVQFLHHEPDGRAGKTYLRMLSLIGRKKKGIELNITIVPSLYIKSMYDAVYENKADVVYPAIRKTENEGKWTARTDGFLFIGRIEEEKNIEMAIEILNELITVHGLDTHLHIIGTGKGEYYEKIKEMARKSSWIYMEGFVSPNEYFKFISSHKYGIHTRIKEPSAVTPREMMDGGMMVFLHKSGGNREIVNGNDSVLFDTKERAIEQIKKVMNDEKIQNEILGELRKLHFNSRKEYMQEVLSKIRSKNFNI